MEELERVNGAEVTEERDEDRGEREGLDTPVRVRPIELLKRGGEDDEVDRARRRHAARVGGPDHPVRLEEEQLIDPEIDVERVLRERGEAEGRDRRREDDHLGSPAPVDRLLAHQPQRDAEKDEADRVVRLHRHEARRDALQHRVVEEPADEHRPAEQNHGGAHRLRDGVEPERERRIVGSDQRAHGRLGGRLDVTPLREMMPWSVGRLQ